MRIQVDGHEVYVSTGGRAHVDGQPFLMFLHGAGFNHFTWVLQSRALAYDNFNVIAADMPGHGLSEGDAIETIEEQAQWALKLLDALGAGEATLVGHSQGALIAMEIAKAAPDRVSAIAFVATGAAIPVNDQLIELSQKKPEAAYRAMVDWAHGASARLYDNTMPGSSHVDYGFNVMRMSSPKTLTVDLKSCAQYQGGPEAAQSIKCPVLCIFGGQDKMTPLKAGKALAGHIPHAQVHIIQESGHTLPTEKPREVNALLRAFLASLDARAAA